MKIFHLLLLFTVLHLPSLTGGSQPPFISPPISAGEPGLLEKHFERVVLDEITHELRLATLLERPAVEDLSKYRTVSITQGDLANRFDGQSGYLQKEIITQRRSEMHYLNYHLAKSLGDRNFRPAPGIIPEDQHHVEQAFRGAAFNWASSVCWESAEKDRTEAERVHPPQKAAYIVAAVTKEHIANALTQQASQAWTGLHEQFTSEESKLLAFLTHDVRMVIGQYFRVHPN